MKTFKDLRSAMEELQEMRWNPKDIDKWQAHSVPETVVNDAMQDKHFSKTANKGNDKEQLQRMKDWAKTNYDNRGKLIKRR